LPVGCVVEIKIVLKRVRERKREAATLDVSPLSPTMIVEKQTPFFMMLYNVYH
jgi:hypothetical protein